MSRFPDLLLSTWRETCSSSSSSLLLHCLVFLWAGGRSGRNSRFSCAKMAAKFASMMLPRVSKRCGALDVQFLRCEVFSRQSRDTTLKESSTKVPIDASLCSLRPPRRGKEVLRIDSDHIQASGFDCLRQHNQRHELGTLQSCVCPGRRPMQASFPFCILLQASNAQSHTSPLWEYLPPDPSQEIDVKLPRRHSKHRRDWSRRLPWLSRLQAPGHASRNELRWCVVPLPSLATSLSH